MTSSCYLAVVEQFLKSWMRTDNLETEVRQTKSNRCGSRDDPQHFIMLEGDSAVSSARAFRH